MPIALPAIRPATVFAFIVFPPLRFSLFVYPQA
jgi:hypothetical protein